MKHKEATCIFISLKIDSLGKLDLFNADKSVGTIDVLLRVVQIKQRVIERISTQLQLL